MLLAALSAVSAATQLPLGDIRRSPAATAMLRDLMTEVWAVGRASGVDLDDGLVDRQFGLVMSQADDSKASLQTDLVAGHRMEIDALQGATVRLGSRARRSDAEHERGLRDPRAVGHPERLWIA